MTWSRLLLVAAAALAANACGLHRLQLPDGTGLPVPDEDGRTVLQQASAECGSVRTMSAVLSVSGTLRDRRIRGRLAIGTASPDALRLELAAPFGQPGFIFVARGGRASLFLPRDSEIGRAHV